MLRQRAVTRLPQVRRSVMSAAAYSTAILVTVVLHLSLGLFAFAQWRATGNAMWVEGFFPLSGTVLLVWLGGIEVWVCARVCREFQPGEPMRLAWVLIACSAACGLGGVLCAQVLGVPSGLNFLAVLPGWPRAVTEVLRGLGLALGGVLRLTLLTAGLFFALRVYRRCGFLSRLRALDWALLVLIGVHAARDARDHWATVFHGPPLTASEVLAWPVDLLLWLLVAGAMLISRSAQSMGAGRVSKTWMAFSVGALLMVTGDMGMWASEHGYLPAPWDFLISYVWVPAAAAFALAPAYQLEAIRSVGS